MDILDKKRINFLAEKFDIYDIEDAKAWEVYAQENPEINLVRLAYSHVELGYAQLVDDKIIKVSIPNDIFIDVVEADPSHNKKYVQWILTNFTTMLRNDKIHEAYRLVKEDLHDAREYLTVFEKVKTTKRFKEVSLKNERIKDVKNPLDINQYYSLELLYDAVDPFIERDSSEILKTMEHMVTLKEAVIPFRDRKFLVYIPKTLSSSVIFRNFASWCTARPENSNFSGYRNRKTPNGKQSELYIVVPAEFLEGKSDEVYQFHFESNQFHDKSNRSINLEDFLNKDLNLRKYFVDILVDKISGYTNIADLSSSTYMNTVNELGLGDQLFKLMKEDLITLNYVYTDKSAENKGLSSSYTKSKLRFKSIKDVSRFSQLSQMTLVNVDLNSLDCDFNKLPYLEMISVPNNHISEVPESIGSLKNLQFLNLKGNPIEIIPESIINLDSSNGGSLDRIAIDVKHLNTESLNILMTKLPNITIIS